MVIQPFVLYVIARVSIVPPVISDTCVDTNTKRLSDAYEQLHRAERRPRPTPGLVIHHLLPPRLAPLLVGGGLPLADNDDSGRDEVHVSGAGPGPSAPVRATHRGKASVHNSNKYPPRYSARVINAPPPHSRGFEFGAEEQTPPTSVKPAKFAFRVKT